MAHHYSPKVSSDGLVLALDMGNPKSYPGSGTSWYDLSPSSLGATLTNGAAYSSNNSGVAYFDTTDDYAAIASSNAFAFGTGDFALDVWIYPTQLSNTYTHMLALPEQNTFALKAEVNTGNIYFYSSAFTTYGSTSGWTLTQNAWNHVVLVRASSVAYAYLNGEAKGSKSGFTNSFSAQVLNIHNGYGSEFAEAYMGPIKIYNRALSATEVFLNFEAHRSRFGL